jgi:hypothetical protein
MLLVGDEGAEPSPLVLDGGAGDAKTGASASFALHDPEGSRYDVEATTFSQCQDPGWRLNRHGVAFVGGEVSLELWLGDSFDLTGPSGFDRASGTLDGVSFDVRDYFQLVYRPDHHHFGLHFAIFFDEPIGDVCALRVEDIDGLEGTTTAVVSTAACDLSVIETRATAEETWEIEK